MNGALAAVLVEVFSALGLALVRGAVAVRKAAANGGEFTPEQRAEADQKIRVASEEMAAIERELEAD